MIRLKQLLFEMTDAELKTLGQKIQDKNFRFIGSGDNGRVYKFNDEDLIFKITTNIDEIEVARQIQNKISEYSTFIPVYYVGNIPGVSQYKDIIIMANAEELSLKLRQSIDRVVDNYKSYAYEQGGEVSLFDFIDEVGLTQIDPMIGNFIQALRMDIDKMDVLDLELDLDFKSDNIMIWNGNMIMVDW